MFRTSKSKTTARLKSSQLNFEGLERRDTPSTTVALSGQSLNITGDNTANTVQVSILDATDQVLVHADGHDFQFASSQVQKINIALKGGDDNLTVQLGAGNEPAVSLTRAKTITADLGAGDDSATFFFGGLNVPNRVLAANLNIAVHAGTGNDEVIGNFGETKAALTFQAFMGDGDDSAFAGLWGTVDAGATDKIDFHGDAGNDSLNTFATFVNGYNQVDIATGATLNIDMNGRDGNDELNTTYGGHDRGTLRIRENGAAGQDQVSGDVTLLRPLLFFGTTGTADIVLDGGSGFDNLKLDVYGKATKFRAEIDGGSGFDHAIGTDNVQIVNANELIGIVGRVPGGINEL